MVKTEALVPQRRARWVGCGIAIYAFACTAAGGLPPTALAGGSHSVASCASGSRPASVGGTLKCLRVGQVCSPRYGSTYRRYGFTCVTSHRRRAVKVPPRTPPLKPPLAPKPAPKPAPPPPPAPVGNRSNPIPVGQPGTAPGSIFSGPFTIVVNSVNPDAWRVVAAADPSNRAPAPGDVDYLVNLTIRYDGTTTADIGDVAAFLAAVGQSGIAYEIPQRCGVLPSPREIDYSDILPGATFVLNLCWQVHQRDAGSLAMYWSSGSSGPWWALH
jgi:hypothetical protein